MKPNLIAAFALGVLVPGAAFAQRDDAPPAGRDPAARRSARNTIPPNSLATIVDKLNWDAAKNGVLLLVGAERIRTQAASPLAAMMGGIELPEGVGGPGEGVPEALRPPALPPPGPNGYRLDAIAGAFRRKAVRAGAVTTLAPIDVAKPPSGIEDMMEGMEDFMMGDREPALMALLVTLTPAQWSQAISETGLGREGLDTNQARLFEALMPMMLEMRFPKGTAPAPPPRPTPEQMAKIFAGGAPDPEAMKAFLPPTLPDAQRATLRLRLQRKLSLLAVRAPKKRPGNDTADGGPEGFPIVPKGEGAAWDEASLFLKMPMALSGGGLGILTRIMGQREPAFPKKSDANYQAGGLQVPVALAGVKTVGDLVERIAKATGVPILADRRYAALNVVSRGDSAKAGDLLLALTRTLHGTVRRLGEGDDQLYLVTDEIVPAARRNAGQFDAVMRMVGPMANRKKAALVEGKLARVRLAASNPLARTPRGKGTDLPETLWQAEEAGKAGVFVPLTSLPEPYQVAAREAWNAMDLEIKSTQLPPDSARGRMTLVAELLLPSAGAFASLAEVDADNLRPDANLDEPVAPLQWPAGLRTRGLFVNVPSDPAVRDALVATASARGVTHFFAEAPLVGDTAPLAALATAAQAKGIRIVPALAPLHGSPVLPGVPRDVSLAGETVRQWGAGKSARELRQSMSFTGMEIDRVVRADYLIPEGVEPLAVANRLEALSKLPGVGAVGLFDLSSPGYGGESAMGDDILWAGGGTLGARLNFIRTEKIDPADLRAGFDMGSMFDSSGMLDTRQQFEVSRLWRKAMAKRRDTLLTRIDTALKRVSLAAPLLNLSDGLFTGGIWQGWTGKWSDVDAMLEDDDEKHDHSADTKAAKPVSGERLLAIRPTEYYTEAFGEDSLDDPHLLRPDEERLASWIGEKVSGAAPEGGTAEGDDDSRWTGFVLDLTSITPEAAVGFLERRIAVQAKPAPAAPKVVDPAKPKPSKAPVRTAPAPKPKPRRR